MSNSTVQGVVHVVQPVETFGTKGFRKRVVVLEQDSGNFINYIAADYRVLGNPEATTTEATPDATTYDNADNADIPF